MAESHDTIPQSAVSAIERETFGKIYALLQKGGIFLGNFWVNRKGKKGCFEIRVRCRNKVITFKSERCFPESFGPQQNEPQKTS